MKPWRRRLRRFLPPRLRTALGRWLNLPARVAAVESGLALLADEALRRRHGEDRDGEGRDGFDLRRHELKVFSQNGEDGVLLALFSLIGPGNRSFVEFGCGDGSEFNALNLLLHWGWHGLLIEADAAKAAAARRFLDRQLGDRHGQVVVEARRLAREDVDGILARLVLEREPDLLSIDVDGNDYWLWQAITSLRPRVVVVEYNAAFGPSRSLVVPYCPGPGGSADTADEAYFGASLAALAHLGAAKGYRLVGCESQGVNAFFVRRDLAAPFVETSPEAAWRPLSPRHCALDTEQRFAAVRHLPFESISPPRAAGD